MSGIHIRNNFSNPHCKHIQFSFICSVIKINFEYLQGVPIKLLEYPIPTPPTATAPSVTKPSHGDISVTKRGIIDPLVSKRPEKILNKKRGN